MTLSYIEKYFLNDECLAVEQAPNPCLHCRYCSKCHRLRRVCSAKDELVLLSNSFLENKTKGEGLC